MTESDFKPHGSGHHYKNDVFCGLLSKQINKWRWAICICFNSGKSCHSLFGGGKKSLSFLSPRTEKKKKGSLLFFSWQTLVQLSLEGPVALLLSSFN